MELQFLEELIKMLFLEIFFLMVARGTDNFSHYVERHELMSQDLVKNYA